MIRTMFSNLFPMALAVVKFFQMLFAFSFSIFSGKVADYRPDRPAFSFFLSKSDGYGRTITQMIILPGRMIETIRGRSSSFKKSLCRNGFLHFRTIRTINANLFPRMCACVCAGACACVRTCGKVAKHRPDRPSFQFD